MEAKEQYTLDQLESFMDWLTSDNVIYLKSLDRYSCQCEQYVSRFTFNEIREYWWKEYGKWEEWEENTTCRNGKSWDKCDCC